MPWKGHCFGSQDTGPSASSGLGSSLSLGRLPPTCLSDGHEGPGVLQGPSQQKQPVVLGKLGEADWIRQTALRQRVTFGNVRVSPITINTIGLVLFAQSQPCEIKSNKLSQKPHGRHIGNSNWFYFHPTLAGGQDCRNVEKFPVIPLTTSYCRKIL